MTSTLDRSVGVRAPVAGPRTATAFRKDINGLRAVAVVAVVLDHARISFFSGGFVGVDVFFVISGFLITQLLLAEAQRTGSISLLRFYNRRARRILPAATLVTVVTVVASLLLLSYVQTTALVQDAVWATFFVANIRFSREQTNYFSLHDPVSPVQHYWSLAVEEQFYLVWPLLLAVVLGGLLVWRSRARESDARPRPAFELPRGRVLAALAVVGGTSLAWSIVSVRDDPTAAYFSTPARAWELAVGAACAVAVPAVSRLASWRKAAMGWSGLALVALTIVRYDASTQLPGVAALGPVLGAAAVIAGGCGMVAGGPGLILDTAPMQRLGDWSYSLYLWHWPFLVIAAAHAGHPLSPGQNLGLLAAALAASVVSYRWVENPFRRSTGLAARTHRGLMLYPAAVASTVVVCLLATATVHHEIAQASSAPGITVGSFGVKHEGTYSLSHQHAVAIVQASAIAARQDVAIPGHLTPTILGLYRDVAEVGACDYARSGVRTLCQHGAVGSHKVMVAFGDSHARAWIPALERIAEHEGYATYYLVKPGCGAADLMPTYSAAADCVSWRAWAEQMIETLHSDVTIIAQTLPPSIIQRSGIATDDKEVIARAVTRGLEATIDALGPGAGRVVLMGDAPGLLEAPGLCLSTRGATLGSCAAPRTRASVSLRAATKAVADDTGVSFIDPSRWFCAYRLCPAVIGSTIAYRDREHISTAYAEELSGPLDTALNLSRHR